MLVLLFWSLQHVTKMWFTVSTHTFQAALCDPAEDIPLYAMALWQAALCDPAEDIPLYAMALWFDIALGWCRLQLSQQQCQGRRSH